ncbi:uncharacterized protein [Ambystoma mexicanum]
MAEKTSVQQILQKIEVGRCVAIEITNNSKYTLRYSGFYCKSGKVSVTPKPDILPNTIDCPVFCKTSYTARGSVGILIYNLGTSSMSRLAVLFSNPFDYNLYDQTFALHVTDSGAIPEHLYESMYDQWKNLSYYMRAEGEFIQNLLTLTYHDIKVTGNMSPDYKSILKLTIEDYPGTDLNCKPY